MSDEHEVRIVWLDDDPQHEKDAENLSSARGPLEVIFLRPKEFSGFLDSASIDSGDLYLIDDKLLKREDPLPRSGFTYAASVRDRFPEIPIYLFSAERDISGIFSGLAEAAGSLADSIIDLKDVLRYGSNFLYYDALDYRAIRNANRNDVNAIYELLKAPEADHRKISLILPSDLKEGLSARDITQENVSGNAVAFAKWARRTLLMLPGLLYDSLYSATKLGMEEELFLEKASIFDRAKYAGAFSRSLLNELWWSSGLDAILFDLAEKELDDKSTTDVRKISRVYFGLSNDQLPRCAVCDNVYPDTVGLNRYDSTERGPVHYACSAPHPGKVRVLYFDEIREYVPREA